MISRILPWGNEIENTGRRVNSRDRIVLLFRSCEFKLPARHPHGKQFIFLKIGKKSEWEIKI